MTSLATVRDLRSGKFVDPTAAFGRVTSPALLVSGRRRWAAEHPRPEVRPDLEANVAAAWRD